MPILFPPFFYSTADRCRRQFGRLLYHGFPHWYLPRIHARLWPQGNVDRDDRIPYLLRLRRSVVVHPRRLERRGRECVQEDPPLLRLLLFLRLLAKFLAFDFFSFF